MMVTPFPISSQILPTSPHGLSFFRQQTNQNKKKRRKQETHTK